MFALKFKIVQSGMPFVALSTFYIVIVFPVPKFASTKSMALCTAYASETSSFLAPSYAVEMARLSTNATNESPVPIASRIATFNVSGSSAQRVVCVKRMNDFTILAYHAPIDRKLQRLQDKHFLARLNCESRALISACFLIDSTDSPNLELKWNSREAACP